MADYTDPTFQRSFHLDEQDYPQEIIIAAVNPSNQTTDLSDRLTNIGTYQTWLHNTEIVRPSYCKPGNRVALLTDHTTGQFDDEPVITRDLLPQWCQTWGFGKDRFGFGGSGFDGSRSPGLGRGAFGAGNLGIDTSTLTLSVSLLEEGNHQLKLRTFSEDGQFTDSALESFDSCPPPLTNKTIQAISYNDQTNVLTLQIQ